MNEEENKHAPATVAAWKGKVPYCILECCSRASPSEQNTPSALLLEALCPDFRSKASSSPWSQRWKLSLANRIFTTAKSSTKHFM